MGNSDTNLRTYLQTFNPSNLYKWILITSIHPANQRYITRFEIILGTLLSIVPRTFKNEPITREVLVNIFSLIENEFLDELIINEDFEPVSQMSKTPIFINGEKFYFFYGNLEFPIYQTKNFIDTFIFSTDIRELIDIQEYILFSLRHQTRILETIYELPESKVQDNTHIYIPSSDYYNNLEHEIIITEKAIVFQRNSLGMFELIGANKIINKILNGEFFTKIKSPYIYFKDQPATILLPQSYTELLSYLVYDQVKKSKKKSELLKLLKNNFSSRLLKSTLKFFSNHSNISYLFNPETKLIISQKFSLFSTYLVDNKIIIFIECNIVSNELLAKEVDKQIERIKLIEKEFQSTDQIEININLEDKSLLIDYKSIEIIYVIVFSPLTLLPTEFSLDFKYPFIVEVINITNLLIILTDLFDKHKNNAQYEFIRFVKRQNERRSENNPIIAFDYLDNYIFDNTYNKFGKLPDSIFLQPHSSSDYFNDIVTKKYSDPIYEIIEQKFPNTFDIVEKQDNNLYELFTLLERSIAWLISSEFCNVWVFLPTYKDVSQEDASIIFDVFKPLIGRHFNNCVNQFIELLNNFININDRFEIFFLSNLAFDNNENYYYFLKDTNNSLNNEEPFIARSIISKDNTLKIYVILNFKFKETLSNAFSSLYNDGDRLFITTIIRSVLILNKTLNETQIQTLASKYIEETEPKKLGGSYAVSIPIRNISLQDYQAYEELNSIDLEIARKKVSEYLYKINIEEGEYEGNESLRVNSLIYDFLQNEIEKIIIEHGSSLFYFAYRQLELIEGTKKSDYIRTGIRVDRKLEEDTDDQAVNEYYLHSKHTTYVRHIIHTILKVNCTDVKYISREVWKTILGYTAALLETSNIYENIVYSLNTHKLIIEPFHEVRYEELLDYIDRDKLENDTKKTHLNNVRVLVNNLNKLTLKAIKKEEKILSNDVLILRSLYKEFNDLFKSVYNIDILQSLTYLETFEWMEINDSHYFPLTITNVSDIHAKLLNYFNDITFYEVESLINYFSLSFDTFNDTNKLIPTEMMRTQDRLAVKPFIKLPNGKIAYGNEIISHSYRTWVTYILEADLPFEDTNESIKDKLLSIHEFKSKKLEIEAEKIAIKLFNNDVIRGLKKFNKIHPLLPKDAPCGEIDLICLNRKRKLLFVLEVKFLSNQRNRPYDIRQTFNDFFKESKRKGYYYKLIKKVNFVQLNIDKFLNYFNIIDKENWLIRPAFVVDQIVYASYNNEFDIDFILLDDLDQFLVDLENE